MLLVDTSVWVEHLRHGHPGLESLLVAGEVVCHPFIIGELACGSLRNRKTILSLLEALPSAVEAGHEDILGFLETHQLMGKGLGLIDVHLLASALLSGIRIWTLDKQLKRAAEALDVAQ
jgi:predicted nucleic acid-binding protein